jgi:hypothetical protein
VVVHVQDKVLAHYSQSNQSDIAIRFSHVGLLRFSRVSHTNPHRDFPGLRDYFA